MAEYIDKNNLYENIAHLEEVARRKFLDTMSGDVEKELYRAQLSERTGIKHMIIDMPAADVAPVVHAEWVYDKNATDWGIGGYICSHCKNRNNNLPCNKVKSALMFSGAKYCPNCGAKMDG